MPYNCLQASFTQRAEGNLQITGGYGNPAGPVALRLQVAIMDVQRQNQQTVHFVREEVAAGSTVEIQVNWERRWDHMQMHTAQHLLSAVVDEVMGADTTSWEMHPFKDSADVFANTASIDLPVPKLSQGQQQEIETTAQIQLIKLVGQTRSHGGTGLSFLAGNRALLALGVSLQREARLKKVLGCGGSDHEAAIVRLQTERKQLHKERKSLLEEVAKSAGLALAGTLSEQGGVGRYHRDGGDAAFLACMAGAIAAAQPQALVLLTASSTPCTGKQDTPGPFLVLGPQGLVAEAGPQVANVLEARGGGRGAHYQGKAQRVDLAQRAEAVLHDVWNRSQRPQ
ncbi:hypothetical protein WJX73_008834 [Symbiochloris irregularis]|uniref:Uncharacterized protein n=1 Tax=Symbiochloris irregularis TaxID=706552 RepID=A0AAW1NLZ4_9CHLO